MPEIPSWSLEEKEAPTMRRMLAQGIPPGARNSRCGAYSRGPSWNPRAGRRSRRPVPALPRVPKKPDGTQRAPSSALHPPLCRITAKLGLTPMVDRCCPVIAASGRRWGVSSYRAHRAPASRHSHWAPRADSTADRGSPDPNAVPGALPMLPCQSVVGANCCLGRSPCPKASM
jgi:hypothetical protein